MIYVDNDNCMNCPYADEAHDVCSIREQNIENAMWTYCINHPRYNKSSITTPLGPMYSYGPSHSTRNVINKAPDTQACKNTVLAEAEKIKEVTDYHCIELDRDIVIVLTLGEYQEQRAIKLLKRIQKFGIEIDVSPPAEGTMWTREELIKAAIQSLNKITEPEKQLSLEQRQAAWLDSELETYNEMV